MVNAGGAGGRDGLAYIAISSHLPIGITGIHDGLDCITLACFDEMVPFHSKFYRTTRRFLTNRVTGDGHFPKNNEYYCQDFLAIVFIAGESKHFIGRESRG